MRRAVAAMLVAASWLGAANAEDLYFPRTFKVWKTKTTEIDRLVVPSLENKDDVVKKYGPAVDLKVEGWEKGRGFTDGANRQWYWLRGPVDDKATPEKLTGWIIKSDFERTYFLTDRGALYGPDCPPQGKRTDSLEERLLKVLQEAVKQEAGK